MATLISEIDCSQHTTREINQAIKRAAADGVPEVRLTKPAARHCLGVAVMHAIRVVFDGPVGWYCGGMCDGAEIVVNGNCGWSVGENLMSGSISVHGNGGNSAGATIRGGRIFVAGDTGARTGISMKGGTVVVGGSVGYMSGFMMQRGTMIVCGDAAEGIGDSMYEGTVYVGRHDRVAGPDCVEAEMTGEDRELLERELLPRTSTPARTTGRSCSRAASCGTSASMNTTHGGQRYERLRPSWQRRPRAPEAVGVVAGDDRRHPDQSRARPLHEPRAGHDPAHASLPGPDVRPLHAVTGAAGGLPRDLQHVDRDRRAPRRQADPAEHTDHDRRHELRRPVAQRQAGARHGRDPDGDLDHHGRRRHARPRA